MTTRFLVDTDILSSGAPSRTQSMAGLVQWMDSRSDWLYLSVVTIAEIEDGIAKLNREGATRRATSLSEWLEMLLHLYDARILPFDLAAARIAGGLSDAARSRGNTVRFADLAIGATAQRHALTVLTRNLEHFAALGVPAHDPIAALPEA